MSRHLHSPDDFASVIVIDGASGAGKTELLRGLRGRFGCLAIEFGVLLRAIAWEAATRGISVADAAAGLAALAERSQLSLGSSDSPLAASDLIRAGRPLPATALAGCPAPALPAASEDAAALAWARAYVRELIRGRRAVVSGREVASLLCPEARLKLRLEAPWSLRRRRKIDQLRALELPARPRDDVALLDRRAPGQLILDSGRLDSADLLDAVSTLAASQLGWRELPPASLAAEAPTARWPSRPPGRALSLLRS